MIGSDFQKYCRRLTALSSDALLCLKPIRPKTNVYTFYRYNTEQAFDDHTIAERSEIPVEEKNYVASIGKLIVYNHTI